MTVDDLLRHYKERSKDQIQARLDRVPLLCIKKGIALAIFIGAGIASASSTANTSARWQSHA
jgi:hypothetical protein